MTLVHVANAVRAALRLKLRRPRRDASAPATVITFALASAIVVGACGGGDSGGGGVTPPPDNTPASVQLSSPGPLSLASGGSSTLTASVRTKDGREIAGASVTWASSDNTVATVSAGVITGVKVGSATITATAGSVTSPGVTVTITPGAAATLIVTRQPSPATVGVPLDVQPVVEIRDAAGNRVTSATTAVTASIATGGGTVTGNATVNAVGGVATFTDLVIIGLAGSKTLAFSTQGLPAVNATAIPLSPGAPTQLGVSVQPAGAAVAVPFTTQPVVHVQDLGGNLVASASALVTVAVGSGGGTLSGTSTVAATDGVVRFSGLTLVGIVGNRTLTFTANGLNSASSTPFALAPGAPASLSIVRQPVGGAVGAPLLVQPAVELRDIAGNLATTATTPVTASVSFGGGTASNESVVPANGIATFGTLAVNGTPGDRELTFSVVGAPTVASARFPLEWIVYGLSQEKVATVDVGSSLLPISSSAAIPSFLTRAGALAAVDAQGRVTALREGEAWVVATNPSGKDSVLAIVPRSPGGPILRTNLRSYVVRQGSTVTVDLVVDPRSTTIGSVSFFLTAAYDSLDFAGSTVAVQPSGVGVVAAQPTGNVTRFSVVAPNGINTPTVVGRLTFTAAAVGQVLTINMTMIDAYAPDGSDLRARVTSTYLPLVSR